MPRRGVPDSGELRAVVDDFHRTSAEHIGRPDQNRVADRLGDRTRRGGACCYSALWLAQPERFDQFLEPVAVFGKIDRVVRCAQDRYAGTLQRFGELQRRLAAELDDDAVQRSVATLGIDDLDTSSIVSGSK